MRTFIVVTLLFTLSACGGSSDGFSDLTFTVEGSAGSGAAFVYSDQNAVQNLSLLSDSHLLNFLEPLRVSFSGRFTDHIDDTSPLIFDSSILLHFYTSSVMNPDGSYLKFSKSKSLDRAVDITFFSRDFRELNLCTLEGVLTNNDEFNFMVQVENNLSNSRIFVWSLYVSPNSRTVREKEVFTLRTADCTSMANNNFWTDLFGVSKSWGFTLRQVELSDVNRLVPYEL